MKHVPVLLNEVIEFLQLKSGDGAVDCTIGDSGHSEKILEAIGPKGKLLGIDADQESLLRAKKYLYKFGDRVLFVRDNFVNLKKIVQENNFGKIKGILMDLGWSSPQFEERGRGFSFQKEEVLDMRYNPNSDNPTAKELLNSLSEKELEKIFREYGEEKNSRKIAKLIVETRKEKDKVNGEARQGELRSKRGSSGGEGPLGQIKTTTDLISIVEKVNKKGKIHPATRVFQALRIAVNDELGVLKKVLPDAIDVLEPRGRLSVITFHSLEDRIVKHYFKSQKGKTIKLINKKPITCAPEECRQNPRARSAKLRIIEKI